MAAGDATTLDEFEEVVGMGGWQRLEKEFGTG